MRTRRRMMPVSLCAVAGLAVAACGGDGGNSTTATTGGTAPVTTVERTTTTLAPAATDNAESDESGDERATTTVAVTSTTAGPTTSAGPSIDLTGREPIQVAYVYLGPVGDAGWTKRHDDGRKALERKLAGWVTTAYRENVPEGADSEAVFEELASQGYDLIIGTSFGYLDPMLAVAERHPEVCFQHASGDRTSANLGTFFGAMEQARYLSGMAAASSSATGRLGYVAAFPIPEVVRGLNAFALGAQAVRPDATVAVRWTNTWFDPAVEASAAAELVAAGADVIAQHQDTAAPGEVATAANAGWIGYNDDMSRFAPEAWLTAPVWNWAPHYIELAEAVLTGTCPTEQYYGTVADGIIGLAPYGDAVPEPTRAAIRDAFVSMVDGSLDPFDGPVVDQAGAIRIAAGDRATLDELFSMDYLVDGVVGEIPS